MKEARLVTLGLLADLSDDVTRTKQGYQITVGTTTLATFDNDGNLVDTLLRNTNNDNIDGILNRLEIGD